MKPVTRIFVIAGLVVSTTPTVLSQDSPNNPSPVPPSSDAIGAQLIAWSELQKPQPLFQVNGSETSERSHPTDPKNTPSVQEAHSTEARSQATERVPNSEPKQDPSVK